MNKPEPNEYNPYYTGYVSLVTETEMVSALANQIDEIEQFWSGVPENLGDHSYEPGKWTVKGVLSHLIDTERVYAYRALRFSKGDPTALPGYDQDAYVAAAGFTHLGLLELVDELIMLRKSNIVFFRNLPPSTETRSGNANGSEITVRAIACILIGHVRHHSRIVAEKYL
jgi:hypothetical protein